MELDPRPSGSTTPDPLEGKLDPAVMEQLLNLDDGALGLVKEMLGLFREDIPGRFKAMEAVMAPGEWTEVADLAHAIKGAAGTMGTLRLRAVAAELEGGARQGAFSTDPALLFAQMKEAYTEALEALGQYIALREP
jgi:HPt (histidine-containing phosphotransfer) domain-containing protein